MNTCFAIMLHMPAITLTLKSVPRVPTGVDQGRHQGQRQQSRKLPPPHHLPTLPADGALQRDRLRPALPRGRARDAGPQPRAGVYRPAPRGAELLHHVCEPGLYGGIPLLRNERRGRVLVLRACLHADLRAGRDGAWAGVYILPVRPSVSQSLTYQSVSHTSHPIPTVVHCHRAAADHGPYHPAHPATLSQPHHGAIRQADGPSHEDADDSAQTRHYGSYSRADWRNGKCLLACFHRNCTSNLITTVLFTTL